MLSKEFMSDIGNFEIIEISLDHIDQVVEVHCIAFPGFFLTELGKEVLRVFYRSLLQNKATLFYGVLSDRELVGFFVASIEPHGLYTRIFIKNIFSFFWPLISAFSRNILFLKRMITSFTSSGMYEVPTIYRAALLSICVHSEHAGKGIGKILLNRLEKELFKRKLSGYFLTTDAENNDATNYFYLSNGFKLCDTYFQGKRKMIVYIKDLI